MDLAVAAAAVLGPGGSAAGRPVALIGRDVK